tara:strand:- start:18 stop:353 length:336 start_codon:yes stop_codon:yes gene_type:complete
MSEEKKWDYVDNNFFHKLGIPTWLQGVISLLLIVFWLNDFKIPEFSLSNTVEDYACESFEIKVMAEVDPVLAFEKSDELSDEIVGMSHDDQKKYFKIMESNYCPKCKKSYN